MYFEKRHCYLRVAKEQAPERALLHRLTCRMMKGITIERDNPRRLGISKGIALASEHMEVKRSTVFDTFS